MENAGRYSRVGTRKAGAVLSGKGTRLKRERTVSNQKNCESSV